jgi:hypothetical protein
VDIESRQLVSSRTTYPQGKVKVRILVVIRHNDVACWQDDLDGADAVDGQTKLIGLVRKAAAEIESRDADALAGGRAGDITGRFKGGEDLVDVVPKQAGADVHEGGVRMVRYLLEERHVDEDLSGRIESGWCDVPASLDLRWFSSGSK